MSESKFSPGPWDWWLRQPEAKVWTEVGRECISVPTRGRLSRLIAAAPEMYALLKHALGSGGFDVPSMEIQDLLARIDGEGDA